MTMYSSMIAFDDVLERVALIAKRRPEEQDGTVTFPGGKVEDADWGEKISVMAGWTREDRDNAHQRCAIRETREETGLSVTDAVHVCTLKRGDASIAFFATKRAVMSEIRQTTDEVPLCARVADAIAGTVPIVGFKKLPVMPNVPWLLLMAKRALLADKRDAQPPFDICERSR